MSISIIYHSHSGKTKNVAEQINKAVGGVITAVTPRSPYSALSVVPMGCYRALRGVCDPVIPENIDVSASDLVIFASPVWAGRPSPVINGAISALTGCRGKKAFIFVTSGDRKSGEQALAPFKKSLEEKGFSIVGSAALDRHQVDDAASISDLIGDIRRQDGV